MVKATAELKATARELRLLCALDLWLLESLRLRLASGAQGAGSAERALEGAMKSLLR